MTKKLNVGCGLRKLDGYDNLDIDPNCSPDILCDAKNMYVIPDETYDIVFSYGFVEHIEPHEIPLVLNEMKRVLKTGGEVQIGTEDFGFQVDLYLREGLNGWTFSAIFGPHYSHRSLFDEKTLKNLLFEAGFRDIHRILYEDRKQKGYDFGNGILFMVARK